MHKKRRKAYRNLIDALLNCNEGEEWNLLQAHQELLDSDFIQVMLQVAEKLQENRDEEGAAFLQNLADALVYQGIIAQLLNCASNEEAWQILDANRDWVDAGLQQTMLEVAEDLRIQGDLDKANFLMNLTGQLMGIYSNPPDSMLDFLLQVLQMLKDSGGDAQGVYYLLEANLDLLNDRFAQTLKNWVRATLSQAKPKQVSGLAGLIGTLSYLIWKFPLGNHASNLEIAIAGYETVSGFIRVTLPELWADSQYNLGLIYRERLRGERAENIEAAIRCLSAALEVNTCQDFPKDWAEIQYNLALAYRNRLQGEQAENLETAIRYYLSALEIYTRPDFPKDWANLQYDLGTIYLARLRGELSNNLESAIGYLSAALEVYDRLRNPQYWADAQRNLSLAYGERRQGDRSENLEAAIRHGEAALEVYNRQNFPEFWAQSQLIVGVAYFERRQGNRSENLEAAIRHAEAALEVYNPQDFPETWARTQEILSDVYFERRQGDRSENLEAAIRHGEAALEVYNRQNFPEKWAEIQYNLAVIYRQRLQGERAENQETSIAHYLAALEIFTCKDFPQTWAEIQYRLAVIYRQRLQGERAENQEASITHYLAALEIFTRKDFPQAWAEIQLALGASYCDQSYCDHLRGERTENLETGIGYLCAALEVYERSTHPQAWANLQYDLGLAYCNRLQGERGENLETAIGYLRAALEVYDRSTEPQAWANTHNNLGFAHSHHVRGDRAENLELAIRYYSAALEIFSRDRFPEEWAKLQNNLGEVYRERLYGAKAENLETAISYYMAALEELSRETSPYWWAVVHNNLGIAYYRRLRGKKANNLEEAIHHYQTALEVHTREAYPWNWANVQRNLGDIYSVRLRGEEADNLEEAIRYYQAALEVHTRKAAPFDWPIIQLDLGNAYSQRLRGEKADNLEEAIRYYSAALETDLRQSSPSDWLASHNGLALAYRERLVGNKADNLERSISHCLKALEGFSTEAFPEVYLHIQYNLSLAYKDTQKLSLAYNTLETAINMVESLRGEIGVGAGREKDKQKLAEEWNRLYRSMVEVCLALGHRDRAIEYVERSKTRNLIDLILNRDIHHLFPSDVVNQLEQLEDEIARCQYQLQTGTGGDLAALAQHIGKLRHQRQTLQDRFLPIGSGFKFAQFQSTLDDRVAIVEWYLTFSSLETFIITRQSSSPILLSFPSSWQTLINWMKGYLDDYYDQRYDWREQLTQRLQELAEILHLDEVLAQLPKSCERLVLVPYWFLHLFPLHALPVKEKGCLLDHFSQGVSCSPSCQLLQLAQSRQRPNFSRLFAVQNPTNDLSYTDTEVTVISHFFDSADIIKKNTATKVNINNERLKTVNCLHLSCHGYFNPETPEKSALLLANAYGSIDSFLNIDPEKHLFWQNGRWLDIEGWFEDLTDRYGLEIVDAMRDKPIIIESQHYIDLDKCLTLDDMFSLTLEQCRLVTLSACETGLIDSRNISDEYIGLPSVFLVAGSPAVVSSLWTVNDLSTALLMIKFYENLDNKMLLAFALNQAQLWLRDATQEEILDWTREEILDWTRLNDNFKKQFQQQVEEELELYNPEEKPFSSPFHWAAFCAVGQ
jgi:CHAT domain-containing protein/predicted LPLAT superfamily acyltransferase